MILKPFARCEGSDGSLKYYATELPDSNRTPDILSKLFAQVLIPESVFNELTAPSTPELVREWVSNRPEWLIVQQAPRDIGEMEEIQIGERQAIALAEAIQSDFVLLDDYRA